jgi:hypothetical protein
MCGIMYCTRPNTVPYLSTTICCQVHYLRSSDILSLCSSECSIPFSIKASLTTNKINHPLSSPGPPSCTTSHLHPRPATSAHPDSQPTTHHPSSRILHSHPPPITPHPPPSRPHPPSPPPPAHLSRNPSPSLPPIPPTNPPHTPNKQQAPAKHEPALPPHALTPPYPSQPHPTPSPNPTQAHPGRPPTPNPQSRCSALR